ncbi:hypothetical protein [Alkalicoccus luteus]
MFKTNVSSALGASAYPINRHNQTSKSATNFLFLGAREFSENGTFGTVKTWSKSPIIEEVLSFHIYFD